MDTETTERASPGRRLRRDAQVRRDALLEAAAACFAESGYYVPLEEIADRAGVGRGTLYRNFKDRMALVYAIFEREVERLDVDVDPDEPIRDTMTRLVLQGLSARSLFTRLASDLMLQGDDLAAFRALGERFAALVEPAAAAARARGELKRSIDGRQLAMSLRMVSGLLDPTMTDAEVRDVIALAIDLLLVGMQPRR